MLLRPSLVAVDGDDQDEGDVDGDMVRDELAALDALSVTASFVRVG